MESVLTDPTEVSTKSSSRLRWAVIVQCWQPRDWQRAVFTVYCHCVYEQRLGAFRMSGHLVEEVSWCWGIYGQRGHHWPLLKWKHDSSALHQWHSAPDCPTIFPTAPTWCHQHTARIVQNFLEAINVVLLWLACSQDMSPTEHLWDIMTTSTPFSHPTRTDWGHPKRTATYPTYVRQLTCFMH